VSRFIIRLENYYSSSNTTKLIYLKLTFRPQSASSDDEGLDLIEAKTSILGKLIWLCLMKLSTFCFIQLRNSPAVGLTDCCMTGRVLIRWMPRWEAAILLAPMFIVRLVFVTIWGLPKRRLWLSRVSDSFAFLCSTWKVAVGSAGQTSGRMGLGLILANFGPYESSIGPAWVWVGDKGAIARSVWSFSMWMHDARTDL